MQEAGHQEEACFPFLKKAALTELPHPPIFFLASGITKRGDPYQSAHWVSPPLPASFTKSLPEPPFFFKVFINDPGVSVRVTHSTVLNSSKGLLSPKIITKIY